MRIACPNCAAEYDVPDAALAAGPRLLKCARCGHHFHARSVLQEEPEPPPPPAPEKPRDRLAERVSAGAGDRAMTVTDRPPPSRGPTRSMPIDPPLPRLGDAPASPPDRFALAGWVVTVAVLIGGALAAYAFRAEIVAAWPPAARVFAALGLS